MGNITTDAVNQDDFPATRIVNVPQQAEKPESQAQLSQQIDESQNQTSVSQATPRVIYQPSGDPRGLPNLKLSEFSGDFLEWSEWAEFFDVIVHVIVGFANVVTNTVNVLARLGFQHDLESERDLSAATRKLSPQLS